MSIPAVLEIPNRPKYIRTPRIKKSDIPDKNINPEDYTPEAVEQRISTIKETILESDEYTPDAVLERIRKRREMSNSK